MDDRVDKLLETIRKTVLSVFPELAGRYHLAARARVDSTTLQLTPLTREGSPDKTAPVIKCDPLPVKVKAGNILRLAFCYGDPAEPVVVASSTAALGTYLGGQVDVDDFGIKPAVVAEYLLAHSIVGTMTAPVDDQGVSLPGATTSGLTRFDFLDSLKPGDRVACLPIEEGDRFIIVAKVKGA